MSDEPGPIEMVSSKEFRRIALGMTDAIEGAHMGHPDFRVGGRIFATLHTDLKSGMVILTPDQQAVLVREHADAFSPESGAWGRQGCTRVTLKAVDEDILGEAMTMAWQNGVAKNASKTRGKRPLRKKKRSA